MKKEEEFIQLIQQHKGIILKIVSLYADVKEDKGDLQQEILYQSWKGFAKFKGQSSFSTWLYKVALNTALTFRKTVKKHQHTVDAVSLPLSSPEPASEEKNQLYWAIKQLPDIEKTIITLHLEGFDNTEIATLIGINRNHLNVKLYRIKNKIFEHLKKEAHGLA